MDKRLKESLSALMDDEANELELQRVLSHADADELRGVWGNYHQVRQVVKTESASAFSIDISAGVAAAIRSESSTLDTDLDLIDDNIFGPNSGAKQSANNGPDVAATSIADRSMGKRGWLALAASVAFALAFVFQAQLEVSEQGIPQLATSQGFSGDASLVKVSSLAEPTVVVEMSEEQARHFSQYLLRHAEHSVRGTQSGFMPLARVASVNSVGI